MKNLSFVQKIVALNIFVVIAVTAINLISMNKLVKHATKEQENALANYADELGDNIASQFYERYGDVQAFANNRVFKENSKKKWVAALNDSMALYGIYDLIVFSDKAGRVLAVNDVDANGKKINVESVYNGNISGESSFKSSLNGKFLVDKEKKFDGTAFSDFSKNPLVSNVYGKDMYGTIFSAPVKNDDGEVIGVISNMANSTWFESQLISAYNHSKSMNLSKMEFTILNAEGKIIADFDPSFSGNNTVIQHDPNIILKLNPAEKGFEAAQFAIAGKSSVVYGEHFSKKTNVMTGYTPIDDPKWPSAIGWSIMVSYPAQEILGPIQNDVRNFYLFSALACIIFGAISYWVAYRFGIELNTVAAQIEQASNMTNNLGKNLSLASNQLSSASQEQSAAIQESVSALSEMGSMISQTSQNAKLSLDSSSSALGEAEEGNRVMERMRDAMGSISEATGKLQGMATIIDGISAKTNVINDIVFKTQLLSFNASIEAARAGQHGKGFSVVAEEVGNLAELSGTAAKDIEILLEESKKHVKDSLEMIRFRVSEAGNVVKHTGVAFANIADQVVGINTQMKSIAEATQQQELGIQQTNSAMKQMEIAAQENDRSAHSTQEAAIAISQESTSLKDSCGRLWQFVRGGKNEFTTPSHKSAFAFWKRFWKKDENKVEQARAVINKLSAESNASIGHIRSEKNEDLDQHFKKIA